MTVINKLSRFLGKQERDPRYVFVLIGASILFAISALQVRSKGLFDSVEQPIFAYFNTLPADLYGLLYGITQFGGLGTLPIWIGAAWLLLHRRAAITLAGTGITAWLLAKVVKELFGRGRPGAFLENIQLFAGETLGGFGFPSGHAAFSAACATILYFYIPAYYRKYLLLLVTAVGLSRMYLGAHFPLDIVGGWALGAMVSSAVLLSFGMPKKSLSPHKLKSFLASQGYPIRSVSAVQVDARGSRPMHLTAQDGTEYFAKIFGKQEHAADWLFKILRLFRYKNLHSEEPYLNSRRNVEMESFAMLWARDHRIRAPKVIELLKYGSSWILLQEKIEAVPLANHGRILTRSLEDTWRQVARLHAANIAHRDLRAANIMIDKGGKAWIIDFGFAEVSARPQRKYMDIAELLMSMSLAAGVDRTVQAACKIVDREELIHALPYLQKAVFSGATTKQLKQQSTLLTDLRLQLQDCLEMTEDVEEADIVRVTPRKILNLALVAIFIYIIAPQFGSFKEAFTNINIQNIEWLIPLAIASLATYVLTALTFVLLADVPLKLSESTLVQLAASFISKFLPGGIANTGINARYLVKAGMERSAATSVLVTQGVISFVMFAVPMSIFLIVKGRSLSELFMFDINGRLVAFIAGGLVLILLTLLTIETWRAKTAHALIKFFDHLRVLASPSREIWLASAASIGVTVAYITCLYASFQAFGLPLGVSAAVLVYASAVIARSVIPTPGGLGPLEIAMVATLVGLGIDKPEAFAVVILYRLATFWLPIPLSVLAYRYVSDKKII